MRTLLPFLTLTSLGLAQSAWPTYQANRFHDGYQPVAIDPATLSQRWEVSLPAGIFQQVCAADGKVFATALNRTLYALDAATGVQAWSIAYPSAFSVNAPAYDSGKVYLQTCNHSTDTYLRCYDAATGSLVFQAPHPAQWENYFSPTIVNGVAYVNAGYYGGMYAFNSSNGLQLWSQTQLPQYDRWTPAVDNGIAYAYIGGYLYALNAATGAIVYSIQDTGFQWQGWSMQLAPVLGGQHDALVVHSGRLVRFDLNQHSVVYAQGNGYQGQPAVKDGAVYAIYANGLRVVDQTTGALLWSWSSPTELLSGAVTLTDSHAIVHSANRTFLIDLQTHQSVWSIARGGSIAIDGGTIYIASENYTSGTVTAIAFLQLPTPAAVNPAHQQFLGAPTPVTVTGSGFSLGQNLEVRFDGVPATGVTVLDDQTLTCVPPVHGPGLVDILTVNSIGQGTLVGGFAYTPALHTHGEWFPGGHIVLSCYQNPGEMLFCAYGDQGVSVQVPPFGGNLEVFPPTLLFALPIWLQTRFDLTLPIPANPGLSGASLRFQTLAGPDVPMGLATFGNAQTVQIQ